jgi:hypothetical protein
MPTVIYDGDFEVVYPQLINNQQDDSGEEDIIKIDDSDKISRDEYLDY